MVNIIPDPIKLFNNENTNKIVLFIFLKFSKSSKTENFKDYLLKKKNKYCPLVYMSIH